MFTSFIVPELQPSHCVVKLLNDVSCGFGDTVDVLLNPPREVFMCVNVASPHCESCTVKKKKTLVALLHLSHYKKKYGRTSAIPSS